MFSKTTTTTAMAAQAGFDVRALFARMVAAYMEKRRFAKELDELRAMSDRSLKDIGLTRGQIGAVAVGAFEPIEPRRRANR